MVEVENPECGLVTLRFAAPYMPDDESAYLAALAHIARREEPFALLAVFGGGGRLTRAGEREQALWFKANRERMNRTCRAIAIVRPNATPQMAAVFRRLWAFPVELAADEAAGRAFLLRHLGGAA